MLTTMHTARVVIAERRLTPSTVTIVRREEKLPNALWLLTAMEQVNHTNNHKGIVDAVMLVRSTIKPATISAQLQIATSNPNQVTVKRRADDKWGRVGLSTVRVAANWSCEWLANCLVGSFSLVSAGRSKKGTADSEQLSGRFATGCAGDRAEVSPDPK